MKIKILDVKNFMSYKELFYQFPENGLWFVGGEIIGRPMSSSNGSGKSAFVESLYFGLFGKTIRNTGKDDIINRQEGKNCNCTVQLEGDDGGEYIIQRFRNDDEHGNNLYLNKNGQDATGSDMKITQETINKVLGMNDLVFATAVIFGSQALRFSEARPSEKAEIFDQIMMFQRYLDAQKIVKQDLDKLSNERRTDEITLSAAKEGLVASESEFQEIEQSSKKLDKEEIELKAKIKGMVEETESLDQQLITLREGVEKSKIEIEQYQKNSTLLLTQITTLKEQKDTEMKQLRAEISQLAVKLATTRGDIEQLEDGIKKARSLKQGGKCPVCGQKITPGSVEAVVNHCNQKIAKLKEKEQELEPEVIKLQKEEDKKNEMWNGKFDDLMDEKEKAEKVLNERMELHNEKKTEFSLTEKKRKTLLEQVEFEWNMLKNRRKDVEKIKTRLESKIDEYSAKIEDVSNKLKESDTMEGYLKFWIEGFSSSGIRSLLLDEVLPQLNDKANFYISMLMDDVVTIKFDTEKTLRSSGEKRSKFNIEIVQDGKSYDYSTYSGGEKQRIDTCILLALQGLIFGRHAGSCSLIFFDEVFERLDEIGIERVVNLLKEESQNKAIFVISHQNELKNYFDSVITVKNKGGISTLHI